MKTVQIFLLYILLLAVGVYSQDVIASSFETIPERDGVTKGGVQIPESLPTTLAQDNHDLVSNTESPTENTEVTSSNNEDEHIEVKPSKDKEITIPTETGESGVPESISTSTENATPLQSSTTSSDATPSSESGSTDTSDKSKTDISDSSSATESIIEEVTEAPTIFSSTPNPSPPIQTTERTIESQSPTLRPSEPSDKPLAEVSICLCECASKSILATTTLKLAPATIASSQTQGELNWEKESSSMNQNVDQFQLMTEYETSLNNVANEINEAIELLDVISAIDLESQASEIDGDISNTVDSTTEAVGDDKASKSPSSQVVNIDIDSTTHAGPDLLPDGDSTNTEDTLLLEDLISLEVAFISEGAMEADGTTETQEPLTSDSSIVPEEPLSSNEPSALVTETPDSNKPSVEPTNTIPPSHTCTEVGNFSNPSNCRTYITCTGNATDLTLQENQCPERLAFSSDLRRCTRDISPCNEEPTCLKYESIADPTSTSAYYWCYPSMLGGFHKYHIQCSTDEVFNSLMGTCLLQNPTFGPMKPSNGIPDDRDVVKAERKLLKKEIKAKAKEEKIRLKMEAKAKADADKLAMKELKKQEPLVNIDDLDIFF